jgi:hypothetical protein
MNSDVLHLNLIQLCHNYGASKAACAVTPLHVRAQYDWEWLKEEKRLSSPVELLIRYRAIDGPLLLHQSLDAIEAERDLGLRARNVLLNWVRFFGMIETGIRGGAIELDLPQNFVETAQEEFQEVPQGFFEELGLPLLTEFRRRLFEGTTRGIEADTLSYELFEQFMTLDASVRIDPYLANLAVLTKFKADSSYRSELRNILKSPDTLVKWFAELNSNNSLLDRALPAVFRSFHFMREVFWLLKEALETNHPFLADSIRSYNMYWTNLFSSTTGLQTLEIIFSSFEGWTYEVRDNEELKDIQFMKKVVNELTSQSSPVPRQPTPIPVLTTA